jgi:hypothetical protein
MCVFSSGMVLWLFLESYGTMVAVSAPLAMLQRLLLHDSDIPMIVPMTFRNKQPIALNYII